MTATHIHIFYTDRLNGWCLQALDDEGSEVETSYHYRKGFIPLTQVIQICRDLVMT